MKDRVARKDPPSSINVAIEEYRSYSATVEENKLLYNFSLFTNAKTSDFSGRSNKFSIASKMYFSIS